MQVKDVTVRVQSLDGVWETLGVDRARGIWPEGVQLAADRWGPSSASCDLHRNPGTQWPDVGAFTPIEFEVGGVVVWSGRVKETPSRDGSDRVLNVQCEGMQYHLDDDQYERIYAQTKLALFKDMRTVPTAQLAANSLAAVGVVGSDGGILLSYPNGTSQLTGLLIGVVLDLGPNPASWAKRAVVTWKGWGAGGTAQRFIIRGSDVPDNTWTAGQWEDTYLAGTLVGPTTTAGTFATARRYLQLILNYNGTNAVAAGADVFVQVTDVKVFSDTAYESGNASVLKAPQVINDALDRATILLSPDRSQIDPTGSVTFSIPEFAPTDPRTPRQVIDAVNAYHNYVTAVDAQRRMVFAPQPAAPQWEVGAWSGMDFQDASANSGENIYNQVLVTGQTPAGEPLRVERTAGQQPGAQLTVISTPTPPNPSFDVDATGWVTDAATAIARTTTAGEFNTAPAGGKWTGTFGANAFLRTTLSGTFKRGVTYVMTFGAKWQGPFIGANLVAAFGTTSMRFDAAISSFRTFSIAWTPVADVSGADFTITYVAGSGGASPALLIDTLVLAQAVPTLVDRRGFRRTMALPINSALPSDGVAAAQIGDVWLKGHQLTPFKGSVSLTGDAVRDILTGQRVPLERLLLAPQALLRFSDRSSPDDGSHGRDGRIASVTYAPATDEASVTIDNTRANLEALLARLAVVSGG